MNKLILSFFTLLSIGVTSCSEADNLMEHSDSTIVPGTIATRSSITNDYFYTQLGVSVKNSGVGPEMWWGTTREYTPYLVKYTENNDDNLIANSLLRIPWSAVEDESGYHFEKAFDDCFLLAYKNRQKICLGIFPFNSWTSNSIKVTAEYKGKEREAYIGYPRYIHEKLMKSDQYKPRLYQNLQDGKIEDDGNPVYYSPDLRNPFFYDKYRKLLSAFREYLDKEVIIDGKKMCRRMLVREVQMRHWGYYGEGLCRYIGPNRDSVDIQSDSDPEFDMETSDDLIKWGQLYTDFFPDIRLIAASNGLWVTGAHAKYQYWLATGRNDYGEFGYFYDMWGENSKTAIGATNIVYNSISLRQVAQNKWKQAPIGGEPWTHLPTAGFIPYSSIVEQVRLVRPAKILAGNLTNGNEPGNTTHWAATEREGNLFKQAYSIMGFRIIAKDPDYTNVKPGDIKTILYVQNIGLTPVYEPWNMYYVFRNIKTNEEVAIRKLNYDIRKLMPADDPEMALKIRDKEWTPIIEEFNGLPKGVFNVYLRISDPDEIVPNMRLSQPGYDQNEEYLIMNRVVIY